MDVEAEAVDGKPARLFFLLLAPSVAQHLGMLARISRLLRHADLRQRLLGAASADAVQTLIREAEARL